VLESAAPPSPAVIDLLSRHKDEIMALLRVQHGWSPADWQAFFDERAAIAEFDGGLSRSHAQAQAFACCVIEWLNRNPAQSGPGRCVGCGGGNRPADPLLPFGTETSGHVWLHGTCWPERHQLRRAEAIAALRAIGIQA
jgi:hypothetical protein